MVRSPARGTGGATRRGDTHVSLLAQGIETSEQVEERVTDPGRVQVLNLHSNELESMSPFVFSQMINLTELNVSSNNLQSMAGIESLTSLKILDLSSNQIQAVEGLGNLVHLRKLLLPFNRIATLEGFTDTHTNAHRLQHVDLRGNELRSFDQLEHLKGCQCLIQLTLTRNGRGNPVCSTSHYRSAVIEHCPQLLTLDDVSVDEDDGSLESRHSYLPSRYADQSPARSTRPSGQSPSRTRPQGEHVASSDTVGEQIRDDEGQAVDELPTPRIDSALEQRRRRGDRTWNPSTRVKRRPGEEVRADGPRELADIDARDGTATSTTNAARGGASPARPARRPRARPPTTDGRKPHHGGGTASSRPAADFAHEDRLFQALNHEGRLESVETKLAHLIPLALKHTEQSQSRHRAGYDSLPTSPDRKHKGKRPATSNGQSSQGDDLVLEGEAAKLHDPQRQSLHHSLDGWPGEEPPVPPRRRSPARARNTDGGGGGKDSSATQRTVDKLLESLRRHMDSEASLRADLAELKASHESETRALQSALDSALASHEVQMRRATDHSASLEERLKEVVERTRLEGKSHRDEIADLTRDLAKARAELEYIQRKADEAEVALRRGDGTAAMMREQWVESANQQTELLNSKSTQVLQLQGELHEARLREASLSNELATVKQHHDVEASALRRQVEAIQRQHESLVTELRQSHAEELQRTYEQHKDALNSARAAGASEAQAELKKVQDSYDKLENEFRDALVKIEAREREIRTEQDRVAVGESQLRDELKKALAKEKKATHLALELKTLVQSQKDRLDAMQQTKTEIVSHLTDTIKMRDSEVKQLSKRASKVAMVEVAKTELIRREEVIAKKEIQQDKLDHELRAKENEVVLQAERLSMRQRTIEDKLRDAEHELDEAKRENDRLNDDLENKDKTIQERELYCDELKGELEAKESEITRLQSAHAEQEELLREQITAESDTQQVLRDQLTAQEQIITHMEEYAAELKSEKKDLDRELETLAKRCTEKDEMLKYIESEIQKVKSMFTEREKQIILEKDLVIAEKTEDLARVQNALDALQTRVDTAVTESQQAQVDSRAKDQIIYELREKVDVTEHEMRRLLRELEQEKVRVKAKMKKLSAAFHALQDDGT